MRELKLYTLASRLCVLAYAYYNDYCPKWVLQPKKLVAQKIVVKYLQK